MALHQPFGKDFDHPSASPDRPEVSVKFRPTQARYVFDAAEPNSLDILPKTEAQELAADTLAAEGFWPDSLPPRPGPGRFPTTAHRGRRTAFPRRSCHVHPLSDVVPQSGGVHLPSTAQYDVQRRGHPNTVAPSTLRPR